jgi:hypothetical protein
VCTAQEEIRNPPQAIKPDATGFALAEPVASSSEAKIPASRHIGLRRLLARFSPFSGLWLSFVSHRGQLANCRSSRRSSTPLRVSPPSSWEKSGLFVYRSLSTEGRFTDANLRSAFHSEAVWLHAENVAHQPALWGNPLHTSARVWFSQTNGMTRCAYDLAMTTCSASASDLQPSRLWTQPVALPASPSASANRDSPTVASV